MSNTKDVRNASEAEAREVAESSRQKEWRKPSFMKELFLGNLRLDLIGGYPNYGTPDRDEYTAFLQRLRAWLLAEIDPLAIDATGAFPEDIVEQLAELGALGMNLPKAYGGLGLSKTEYCRTMELSGSYEGSLMGFLSPHQSVGVPEVVKLFGTQEQKERFLPRCAQGDVTAFALTEADVGSDPARLTTSLETSEDGSHYLLNGTKIWCTNGLVAKLLVVMARHSETGKISAVVVEMDTPGVAIAHRCHFMGLSALQNGVITFENVRVPIDNRIGDEGAGLRIALTALNTGRLSIPYGMIGPAKKCLEVTRLWASERTQWGVSIGKHEAIAHKVAKMASTVFAMEALVRMVCELTDQGRLDLRLESAAAKEFNTSRTWDIIDDTMQIRGGRGYEKESSLLARGERGLPCERIMRDQRVARIFEGSSEIMHLLIAREAVDKHLQVAGAFIDPKVPVGKKLAALPAIAAFYAVWYPTRWITLQGWFGYGEYGELARHARFLDRAAKKLARAAFHGMMVYQARLEKKQAFLFRWVDIALELVAMTSVLLKAHAMREQNDAHTSDALQLAHVFCDEGRLKVRGLFRDLWSNHDAAKYGFAQRVLQGDYAWLEEGIISQAEIESARRAAPSSAGHGGVPLETPEPELAAK